MLARSKCYLDTILVAAFWFSECSGLTYTTRVASCRKSVIEPRVSRQIDHFYMNGVRKLSYGIDESAFRNLRELAVQR